MTQKVTFLSEKRTGNIAKRRLLVNPYGPEIRPEFCCEVLGEVSVLAGGSSGRSFSRSLPRSFSRSFRPCFAGTFRAKKNFSKNFSPKFP